MQSPRHSGCREVAAQRKQPSAAHRGRCGSAVRSGDRSAPAGRCTSSPTTAARRFSWFCCVYAATERPPRTRTARPAHWCRPAMPASQSGGSAVSTMVRMAARGTAAQRVARPATIPMTAATLIVSQCAVTGGNASSAAKAEGDEQQGAAGHDAGQRRLAAHATAATRDRRSARRRSAREKTSQNQVHRVGRISTVVTQMSRMVIDVTTSAKGDWGMVASSRLRTATGSVGKIAKHQLQQWAIVVRHAMSWGPASCDPADPMLSSPQRAGHAKATAKAQPDRGSTRDR